MATTETLYHQPVSSVEYGDLVRLASGDLFYAYSKAEKDQWGDINILDSVRYRAFPEHTLVEITRDAKPETYDAY